MRPSAGGTPFWAFVGLPGIILLMILVVVPVILVFGSIGWVVMKFGEAVHDGCSWLLDYGIRQHRYAIVRAAMDAADIRDGRRLIARLSSPEWRFIHGDRLESAYPQTAAPEEAS